MLHFQSFVFAWTRPTSSFLRCYIIIHLLSRYFSLLLRDFCMLFCSCSLFFIDYLIKSTSANEFNQPSTFLRGYRLTSICWTDNTFFNDNSYIILFHDFYKQSFIFRIDDFPRTLFCLGGKIDVSALGLPDKDFQINWIKPYFINCDSLSIKVCLLHSQMITTELYLICVSLHL